MAGGHCRCYVLCMPSLSVVASRGSPRYRQHMPSRASKRCDKRPRTAQALACGVVAGTGLIIGGCSGALDVGGLSLPVLDVAALGAAMGSTLSRSPVTAQETYIRIARGAHACWFGAKGAYRETHVFYADAEPTAKGGTADIIIHERDRVSERPWGLKALRIHLKPVDDQADVSVVNLKMADADVQRMTSDIARWIQGQEDCGTPPVATTAAIPSPAVPAVAPAVQPKK